MKWRFNIAVFVIIIFIFLNDVGLPYGLQYTALLTPFFFLKYGLKYWKSFALFFFISAIYLGAHLFNDEVTWFYYFRSQLLHFMVFVQVVAFYFVINYKSYAIKKAFDWSVYINLSLLIFGILLLIIGFPQVMFEVTHVSKSVGVLPRFRIFTVEPSYYSMLMVPLLFFYLTQPLDKTKKIDFEKIILIAVSLLISFSFGVLSLIFVSIFIVYLLRVENLLDKKKRNLILSFVVIIVVIIGGIYLFKPDNPLFIRFGDIISGNDSSGKGRITQPWILAMKMLSKNGDYWLGIGWGQIRIIGNDIIKSFYQYTETPQNKFGLPNVLTEITTMFGFVGLVAVLLFQIIMFKVTKVYQSYFRSLIFWFIFIYQFTGSYSSSVLFYCYWVLAFSPAFDKQLKIRMNAVSKTEKMENQ
ncbi:MAG: hypothetical protein COA97_12120 [Flavobacteriales bacterium]|nr:MAG: hypothetical protein COA97_12120 [Flavobacteriales bacterium]